MQAGLGRQIADVAHPHPVAAVMREINETLLGRTLTIAADNGPSVTLEVAGRRVLRLTQANGIAGAEACLAAAALEDEHKDSLIDTLQALAVKGRSLWVQSTPMTRVADGVSVGLPVALLADLLLVDLDADDSSPPETVADPTPDPVTTTAAVSGPTSVLGRFARANEPVMLAWLIQGGVEDGLTFGPEEMVTHLHGFLEEELRSISSQLDLVSTHAGEPVCIALGASLNSGHGVLCARADNGLLLGLIEGNAAQFILPAWTAALR